MKAVPPISREPLLIWLESSGRLKLRELDEVQDHKFSEDLDDFLEPEIQILEDEEEETN